MSNISQVHTLQALSLAKQYQRRWVVKDFSMQMKSGEIVGLLGPNGAGKTTAFYMIVGLVKANKGQVILNSDDITALPMHRRARIGIGYLPQESSIFRKLTVEQNLMAILETRKDLSPAERQYRVDELLDEFHITHIRNNAGMSLSGGERRRTEIARAMAISPYFMLLDEPFAGVDPISVIDIKRIITELSERGYGILITDHNVRETLDICERAYIANDGEIIATGAPDELLANEKVRKVYLGNQFRM